MPEGLAELFLQRAVERDGLRIKICDAPARLEVFSGNGIDQSRRNPRAAPLAEIGDVEVNTAPQKLPCEASSRETLPDNERCFHKPHTE